MPKRRLTIGILAVVVVGIALCALIGAQQSPPPEPSYKGRKLSEWARWRTAPGATDTEHAKAIRHIGTNAIPHLLEWIAYEPPAGRRTVSALLGKVNPKWRWNDPQAARAYDAMDAFQILGPEAAGAAEDLARFLKAPDAPTTAARAARALAHLGEKAFPSLLTALTNAPIKVRADVAAAISTFLHIGGSYGTNTALAVSGLTPCLKEQDRRLVSFAIMALYEMTNAPDLVVPVLADCLRDSRDYVQSTAAFGLSKLEDKARPAVPALVSMLSSPDPKVRTIATQALRRIDPHALTNALPR